MQKQSWVKPGFPFEEHEEYDNHDHEKIMQDQNLLQYLRFQAKSSKRGPGYPYKKVMQEQTQKHGFRSKLSDQNETFFNNLQKLFSLYKTNFNAFHDIKNDSDHAMQLDDQ